MGACLGPLCREELPPFNCGEGVGHVANCGGPHAAHRLWFRQTFHQLFVVVSNVNAQNGSKIYALNFQEDMQR